MGALFIEDLVSRRWITTVVSSEDTHTQVQYAFEQALEAEGLLEAALERADALGRNLGLDGEDELTPILLAVSDNGSQMISVNTRKFMAMFAIAQHFGRPSTPTEYPGDCVIPRIRCCCWLVSCRPAISRDSYFSPASWRIVSSSPFQSGAGSGVSLAAC